MIRHSLTKGTWSKLLPPSKAWLKSKGCLDPSLELPGEDVYDCHPFWEHAARVPVYHEMWRKPRIRRVHINVGEMHAHLHEESRVASNHSSVRVPYALDSQVCLGALTKGRAASPVLNALLRRSLSIMFGADLYSGYLFFPSKLNRADGPTRDSAPSPPDLAPPDWWMSLENGDCEQFDAWMRSIRPPSGSATVADLDELLYRAPLPLRTGRRERRDKICKCEETLDSFPSVVETATEKDASPCQSDRWCGVSGSVAGLDSHSGVKVQSLNHVDDNAKVACEDQAAVQCGQLCPEAISILQSFSDKQFVWPEGSSRKFDSAGALDLYSGRAGVAKKLVKLGCPFVLTFEWKRSASENLLDEENRRKIRRLLQIGAIKLYGSAIICSSFSRAITPGVRSKRYPRGLRFMRRSMRQKVREGNSHSDFNAEMLSICRSLGIDYWLENPDSSFLWQQRGFKLYRDPQSPLTFRLDYCRFGAAWRKRTRVALSFSSLQGKRMFCTCKRAHITLRGQRPNLRIPWTAVAEPYPRSFAHLLAASACIQVGWLKQRLDIARCCRSASLRVGEALNPGPRRRRGLPGFSLEDCPLQNSASLAMGDREWEKFLLWSSEGVPSIDIMGVFFASPLVLMHFVRSYGDKLFMSGGSLLYYRNLVLTAVRKNPNSKAFAHVAWDLASRWEIAEPVTHRTPTPLPILKALIALGWHLGFRQWCGIASIGFHGIARIGEVLQARRHDLLLPSDLLENDAACYLVLWKSKTSNRHPARVQHLKITDEKTIKLLEKVYQTVPKTSRLYYGSPSMFRKRWDVFLQLLGVSSEAHLTPAGLRGGGAVHSYRQGVGIADIQWRMRVRNLQTLESYIQEVAALSALQQLTPEALKTVRHLSSIFDCMF